jgi:hypothetical protein
MKHSTNLSVFWPLYQTVQLFWPFRVQTWDLSFKSNYIIFYGFRTVGRSKFNFLFFEKVNTTLNLFIYFLRKQIPYVFLLWVIHIYLIQTDRNKFNRKEKKTGQKFSIKIFFANSIDCTNVPKYLLLEQKINSALFFSTWINTWIKMKIKSCPNFNSNMNFSI